MNLRESQTAHLLRQMHLGNQDSIGTLLEKHLPWIRKRIRLRMGGVLRKKGDTMDYVQEAVVQFLQYGPRFTLSNDAHFRALLLRIAENSLRGQYDWYTAQRRNIALERPLPPTTVLSLDSHKRSQKTPSKEAMKNEEEAWVRLGMEFLDEEDREVLVLRQWEGKTLEEIANQLGISANTVWYRNKRAVKNLGEKIWELKNGRLLEEEG